MGDTVQLATLTNLITSMKTAIEWIFGLFTDFCNTIASNDLLLYPVLLFIVIGVIGIVIKLVRSFGMRSRRS